MSLIRRNANLFNSLPSPFNDDFFTRDLFNWGLTNNSDTGTTIPAVNLKETPHSFEVEMAAPGMTKDDFSIELDSNVLTITSEKKMEQDQKEGERYSRKEFSYQSFQRTFSLPKEVVDDDKIEARYENGVLHLVIPKKEEAKQKPARMIQIH
ncbi:MAG TPA: Hsp20/alpha crystallin family protein [Flavitalea sp.]|nr:Hsp20/alpha crystallin family protein [Flavitalea sp.]